MKRRVDLLMKMLDEAIEEYFDLAETHKDRKDKLATARCEGHVTGLRHAKTLIRIAINDNLEDYE